MYKIRHNRFMTILHDNNEELYICAVAFSMLCEEKWKEELHGHPVKHGYIHVSNIIHYIELLFTDENDDYILNKLGEEGIFILLSAIYIHDLGMQNYYDFFDELKGKEFESLSEDDKDRIRNKHTEIIYKKIRNLTDESVIELFGTDYEKITQMYFGEKPNILTQILDYKVHIAFVASHHNQKQKTIDSDLNNLKTQNEIVLDKVSREKLIFVTSLLQFGDALDMSKVRIDENEFKIKVNEGYSNRNHVVSRKEYKNLDRMLNCFIIDKIEMEKVDKQLIFKLKMSVSQSNLSDHKYYLDKKVETYKGRLQEHNDACTGIIESFLNKTITIREVEEGIVAENNKHIPDYFFEITKREENTIQQLIHESINELNETCEYSYVKLYSGITNVYHGGFTRKDLKESKKIEQLFFYEDEWNIKDHIEEGCGAKLIKLPDDAERKSQYKCILDAIEKNSIKSSIYYAIKYEENVIGFIRAYYKEKQGPKKVKEKCKKYNEILEKLGQDIIELHKDIYVKRFKKYIKGTAFFNEYITIVNEFVSLYEKMYLHNTKTSEVVHTITVAEFRKLINDGEPKDKLDKEYEVMFNEGLFELIFNTLEAKYYGVGNREGFKKMITNNVEDCYIIYVIVANTEFLPIEKDDMDYVIDYLSNKELMEIDFTNHKDGREYAFIIKAFFTIFSGYILAEIKDNNLVINILLPKRKINIEKKFEKQRVEMEKFLLV